MLVMCLAALVVVGGESRTMRVTAYCPCKVCCGKGANGVTAWGWQVRNSTAKIVAADRGLPFGTRLFVPGYGLATVADRGGAIRGNRLDVFFPTHKQARQWGVRNLKITLYHGGKYASKKGRKE